MAAPRARRSIAKDRLSRPCWVRVVLIILILAIAYDVAVLWIMPGLFDMSVRSTSPLRDPIADSGTSCL